MGRSTVAVVVAGAIGVVALLRQRREAARVRDGRLRPLGPDGQPAGLPSGRLHAAIAAWRPAPPRTLPGRLGALLWSGPLTVAGLVGSVLGGAVARRDHERACLVARGVGGPLGAFLAGQGASAATLGRVVVSRSEAPSPRLLDHEAVHVRQQERLGPLFAAAYPLASAVWGYRANPFEVAARAAARPAEVTGRSRRTRR